MISLLLKEYREIKDGDKMDLVKPIIFISIFLVSAFITISIIGIIFFIIKFIISILETLYKYWDKLRKVVNAETR